MLWNFYAPQSESKMSKQIFHLASVIWFDKDKGYGFLKSDSGGPNVMFDLFHASTPFTSDILFLRLNQGKNVAIPKSGNRIVYSRMKNKKGYKAANWCYLEAAAKTMRDQWIRTHDKCACGHLFSQHQDGFCSECDYDCINLCTCGHRPEDHDGRNGCMLCKCGHRSKLSESQPDLSYENEEICPVCQQLDVVCTCDTKEYN